MSVSGFNNSYRNNRSKTKRIQLTDRIITDDKKPEGGLKGVLIFGKGRHDVHYIDPYGRPAVRSEFEEITDIGSNIVTIGGYQYAFDKLFNIGLDQESTLRIGDLNDEAPQMKIGVPRESYESIYYDAECSASNGSMVIQPGVNIPALHNIFGFLVGDGGSREDNITAIAPNYKNRNLYRAIPFRMSNDGYPMEEGVYYGNTQSFTNSGMSEPIISSYIKRFDNPRPRIVHCWVTDNPNELSIVDDTVFSSTSSIPIESYVEINISVNTYDCRGFFTSTNSSPRVNEFGLVAGWYNPRLNDYEKCLMISHFTRPSISLTDGDSIEAIYRLYAR